MFKTSQIKRETEKAWLITVDALIGGGINTSVDIWLPKSQITETNGEFEVPGWLVEAKAKDLRENYNNNSVILGF